jgi:endoglucanase
VILAPWGETTVNAGCFLHGGGAACGATVGTDNRPYRVAGMQQAVDVMRAAGYRGPIAIPGIDYANDLTHWLSHRPRDPRHQLIAEAHVYGGNSCADTACLDRTMGKVARSVPLILGETGETYDATSCGHRNTERFVGWADANASGSMTWAWDTWGNCSALIDSYGGKPHASFGRFVHDRYMQSRVRARRIP